MNFNVSEQCVFVEERLILVARKPAHFYEESYIPPISQNIEIKDVFLEDSQSFRSLFVSCSFLPSREDSSQG